MHLRINLIRQKNVNRFFLNSDGCVCAGTETETEAATACDEVNSDYCDSEWVFSSKDISILKVYKHVKHPIFPYDSGCHCAANADNNFGVCTGSQDTCVE